MPHAAEQDWLLLSLSRSPDDERLKAVETARLDWDFIRQQALAHGIAPLLYARYSHTPSPELLPAEIVSSFQEAYQQIHLWNTFLYQQFTHLLNVFQPHRIVPIALKGILLARWVYAAPALRPMHDIDLLLKEDDLETAEQVLRAEGYSDILSRAPYLSDWHKAQEQRRFDDLKDEGYHVPALFKPVGALTVCVELHHHLTPLMLTRHAQSEPLEDAEFPLRTLRPEFLLLHLCFHAQKHFLQGKLPRLIWYSDLAECLRMYGARIDWGRFLALCREFEVDDEVTQSLAQAHALIGMPVPPDVPLPAQDRHALLAAVFPVERPSEPEREFLRSLTNYTAFDRVRYARDCLLPSPAFMMTRYDLSSRWMLLAYYPLRVLKAAVRGVKLMSDVIREKWGNGLNRT